MIKEEYKYSALTEKIIGCAMRVYAALGNVFQVCLPKGSVACRQEVIYQRAMAIEMADSGLTFSHEHEMPVYYKNQQIGTRRVDFLIEEVVSLEMKATTNLEDAHLNQGINYLEAYELEVGLLIYYRFSPRSGNIA